jgi:hypothetical protein
VSNVVPGQYRRVSVATVDGPLTPERLTNHFLGREAYRHTRFIVARAGRDTALVRVVKADDGPLFSPITSVEVLAVPEECVFVVAPDIDTGIPSALAQVAAGQTARCVVVEGRYHHVSFILDPAPIRIRVGDVVPPRPAKLFDQARRVLELAEDLPPIELVPDFVDLVDLAAAHPSEQYLVRAGARASAWRARPPSPFSTSDRLTPTGPCSAASGRAASTSGFTASARRTPSSSARGGCSPPTAGRC